MEKFQVVIIGGGVGGLTLALRLAQSNVKVLVIERDKNPGKIYKGELLQPKSLLHFQEMGIADNVLKESLALPTIHTYEVKEDKNGTISDSMYIPLHYDRLETAFPEARMIPHEKLKEIIFKEAEKLENFHYWNPAVFKKFTKMDQKKKKFSKASVKYGEKEIDVEADFFVGAEGRASLMRKAMNQHLVTTQYNHHFLTVTFPRPANYTEARMYASHKSFIGLFPLPNNEVRCVMLIKPGEYNRMKKEGLHTFTDPFIQFEPELKDYVTQIASWKQIQLMIPIRHNIHEYVQGNAAIIGDAAHAVHPMAGEGMNLAIQDGANLGDLLAWMYENNQLHPKNLKKFERVRKKRSDRISMLSHFSALGYAWSFRWYQFGRMFALKRFERHPILHYKHMLNISGVGWWTYTPMDVLRFFGPASMYLKRRFKKRSKEAIFSESDDYPWRYKK
ncbi:FAD-dependent oxidoreductase [Alkalicoccus daliensis]|uniref:2-polyprenyl-6-methoxyphenol hydroxylase n=1 Tax=Alkalicoccus daliensis TaxID=745820 RepID=A0A1H0ALQ7_9BACI|nr:NAD(P)/FAD-dependent oxidoreductase [Alkalicoccus daliensis]SDN34407.1 2-polyprenyl-6-methoxyphenol hydroxylase [Alkalicoccus daliensis]